MTTIKPHPQASIAEVSLSLPHSAHTLSTTSTTRTRTSSPAGSLNSRTLAWDQTYLRITYLVSTMGPNSPSAVHTSTPSIVPPNLDGEAALLTPSPDAADNTTNPLDRAWPAVSRDKVRRKIAQLQTWAEETSASFGEWRCACGDGTTSSNTTVHNTTTTAGDLPQQQQQHHRCPLCALPYPPPISLQAADMRGMRKALSGFRTLVRRASLARLRRAEAGDGDKGKAEEGEEPPRTEMYRADLRPVLGGRGGDGEEGDYSDKQDEVGEIGEVDEADEVDDAALGGLSSGGSSNGRGLLRERHARLARAQRLLARSYGGGASAALGGGGGAWDGGGNSRKGKLGLLGGRAGFGRIP